jgi:hypothetical protein
MSSFLGVSTYSVLTKADATALNPLSNNTVIGFGQGVLTRHLPSGPRPHLPDPPHLPACPT